VFAWFIKAGYPKNLFSPQAKALGDGVEDYVRLCNRRDGLYGGTRDFVGAVFNARRLVCGCVSIARKFTPQARAMFVERKRAKTHMTQVWINTARCKHARAIGSGEGRGPTWPLGRHHVDDGVWNAWVCACANYTRPTRGTRRRLGSVISSNEELVNINQQTPHKLPHEVCRIRRVLLGTAAQLCRDIS
jgi:hypothetical protein